MTESLHAWLIKNVRVSALLVFSAFPVAAEQTRFENPENGLIGWKLERDGLQLELIQRLPDQTRGFFLARGFTSAVADDIGTSCVFQTIARNSSDAGGTSSIDVSLPRWRIRHAGQLRPIKLKEQWDRGWQEDDVTPAARLAFRWATFPTEQSFDPGGDYGWGMISFDLPPAAEFDLHVKWMWGEQEFDEWMHGLVCAPDR